MFATETIHIYSIGDDWIAAETKEDAERHVIELYDIDPDYYAADALTAALGSETAGEVRQTAPDGVGGGDHA
jgi:hypothetical protein